MNRTDIQIFLAVVEYGSLSKAAENLFQRQSTLSTRLLALEKELGITLFTRGKGVRNTELTEAGEDFLLIAEKWERLWAETMEISEKGHSRSLSISAIYSLNAYILNEVYMLYAGQNPQVSLQLRTRRSDESYHLVESGIADAAFVTKDLYSKRLIAVPLFYEKMVFVCNAGYKTGKEVSPRGLDVSKEVLVDWHHEFSRWNEYWFGENATPRVYTDDLTLMETFLGKEACWAAVPVSVAHSIRKNPKIKQKTLIDAPLDRPVYMLLRRNTPMSEELSALISNLKEVVTGQGANWVFS
ncbi:MAG: LysR family transcriptional regulator [Clostridiales Family XIII bacterium]|jgi:DNA-binding transcriptional LysR family regulator|nr:LysR family transcriptional regulator [Clostridiales Family XIII bacterium]